eukprot:TRINITY_DN16534_c0_g1_i5.p1 TRINITY_DN16534_c0_g1~~TRINITY_DN16534_c0_g1_i5.p1  ORF type:complete len:170 (+),score=54.66 TRINITY_DN16534_c0_g1_i5:221-730(+)
MVHLSHALPVVLVSLILFITPLAEAGRCDNLDVCKQWYNDIFNNIDYSWSKEKVEGSIDKYCDKVGDKKPMNKMCYYLHGVKRKVSTAMLQGAPAELACKRFAKDDDAICALSFPKALDPNMNLEKMRVKQLRQLMQDNDVECINCLEKSDMVKRIKETLFKSQPKKDL